MGYTGIMDEHHIFPRCLKDHPVLYDIEFNSGKNLKLMPNRCAKKQLYYNEKSINTSKFYGLPKMHKSNLTLRPIISNRNTITFYTSKYLHNILFKLVKKLPTICYNSYDVILKCQNLKLNDTSMLFVADIDSMYPSIPIGYGLKAVRQVMIQYQYELDNIDFILELLAWVLNNNYLEFNNKVYKQIKGTAMGSPVSVSYANITIYYLEQKCLILNPLLYIRFVDDIFCITNGIENAMKIKDTFNSVNVYIFIKEYTIDRNVNFLDLNIIINDNNIIETKMYQKPINKFLYIPHTSLHNKHIIKNNIVNEIRRIILLNTSYYNALIDIKLFKNRLKDRGYSNMYLNNLFNPNTFPSRVELLSKFTLKYNKLNIDTVESNNNLYLITSLPKCNFDKKLTEVFKISEPINNLLNNPKLIIVNANKNNSINMTLHHNKQI
jgi:hypothetical protein